MFKSKRLRGGHRVGLQTTQNISPAIQNAYSSQPAPPASEDNSWDWGASNIQLQGSIHDNQNSAIDSKAPSHTGFQNQKNFHQNSQYRQTSQYPTNIRGNLTFNSGSGQNAAADWPSQGNDDWNWEENKWDDWESGGQIPPNQHNTPQSLHDTQEQFHMQTQPTQPANDSIFEKVDAVKYREHIENAKKYGTNGNENSNNYQAFPNDNPYNAGIQHKSMDSINQDIPASKSEDYSIPQINQQYHQNYSSHDKMEIQQIPLSSQVNNEYSQLAEAGTNENVNSDWNWDSDNWGAEQVVGANPDLPNPIDIYQPSVVSEAESKLENLKPQEINAAEENVSNNVANSGYEKEPEFNDKDEVNNSNYPAEPSTLWENDNWSNNGFSSDESNKNRIEQHHLPQIESDTIKSSNNLNNISVVEVDEKIIEIPQEHTSNESFYHGMETQEIRCLSNEPIIPVENVNIPTTEWSYDELAIATTVDNLQTDGQSSTISYNSMAGTSLVETPPQSISLNSGMHIQQESHWQNFAIPSDEMKSPLPEDSSVSHPDEFFDRDSNANVESIEDNNFYESENIISVSSDENILIPAVKPKLREEILSEYKAAISRSRTTSLTDSTKESNIAALNEELQGIFSSPTDLVNYPSVEDVRNRTSSFTRLSHSISELSVHSEPGLHSPMQVKYNPEEADYETNEIQIQPSSTEIENCSSNSYNCNNATSSFSTYGSAAHMQINAVPIETTNIEETTNSKFHPTYIPATQESLPSPAIGVLPSLNHFKDSPFQPPEQKQFQAQMKPSYDKFDHTDNQFNSDHLVKAASPISGDRAEHYDTLDNPHPHVDHSERRETSVDRREINSVPAAGGAPAGNIFSKDSTQSAAAKLTRPRVVKQERASPLEEKFTRMIPGESSKGKRGPSVHPTPPAMPTGRVVTGNDHPRPLTTSTHAARIKQEPNEVRSPPDGPDTQSPINHDASVMAPVRSETIGSEVSSGGPVSRKDKSNKTEPASGEIRGLDYDSSSGEYYTERYRPDSKRPNAYYYREGSPNGQPSYDHRDYDSKYRRPRYVSDDEEDDREVRFAEQRNRRHRSYREDQSSYAPSVKHEPGYHRKRDHPHDQPRGYRHSTADEDAFYQKSDRSRPSSRSSSPTNHDGALPQKQSNARYRDKHYDKPQRRPSQRDYYPDRSFEKGHSRDQYARGYGDYPEQYGSQSRAMYDQSYYYHYYQKYMEQHPYYRDQYRQYYGRNSAYPGSSDVFPEDKASIRSGRSSVNEELKKSTSSLSVHDPYAFMYGQPPSSPYHNSQYRQDYLEDSSIYGGYAPSLIYPNQETTNQSNFYLGGDVSGAPSVAEEIATEKLHRLTPHQFGAPHFISKFTPGGKLLVVLPHDPKDGEEAIVEIKDMQELLATDEEYSRRIEQMESYDGPIAYNDTHKDVVIGFCALKITEAAADTALEDQQSVILLWEYLSLLVRQNGKASGGDLAALLLKRKNKCASPIPKHALDEESEEEGATTVSCDPASQSGAGSSVSDVRPFTEYLCLGRRKEAVEYAIRHELWGHAMMLASKMDAVTHTRVMTAFMRSIPTSDVLQTAVQHMSGKRPDVTKNFNPERWGDWREHLAVLVSNSTGNAQRDNASIVGLGDSLSSRGQLHAAHICYVAAEVEWGTFADKSSKIVLIGSSHDQCFQTFVSEDAFQCTEVFEYAKSLDGTNEFFHTFQSYKLIYALRLAECGFAADALRYCEVVSNVVCQSPQYYQEEFVAQVLELASRLKFYDAHYQLGGEMSEMPDPEWLQNLSTLLYSLQVERLDPSNPALVDDGSSAAAVDSQPFPKTEGEVQTGQDVSDNITAAIPHVEALLTPQHTTYNQPTSQPMMQPISQPLPHDSVYHQHTPSQSENYMSPANYPAMGIPPANVSYEKTPESVSPYEQQQSPVLQRQEPAVQWQPAPDITPVQQPESPPMNTLQRRSTEEEEYWATVGNKPVGNKSKNVEQTEKKPSAKDIDAGKDGEERPGFFGSFFGGWKKNNQAKLPDDSNHTIVWDERMKKWVNKDGEEETEGPPPPPPTSKAAPPLMTGSFRGGLRVSRYVDPIADKRRSSGPLSLPPNGSLSTPTPAMIPNGTAHPARSPVATPSTFIPPGRSNGNILPGSPVLELEAHAVHLDSSRQDADSYQGGNPVPMMGAPPMFNPNQFGAPTVPSTGSLPRKAGPARRAYGQR